MSRARSVRIAVAALLALGGGFGLWFARGRSVSAAAEPDRRPELSREERLAALDNSLRAISDGVRFASRDRWDPAYVAQHWGPDPDALRKWVQLNTSWIPYRGVLRGPVGVLMDRQGNSLDRALLLAKLLTESGHRARLARAELPLDRANQLLPDLVARSAGMSLEPVSEDVGTAPVEEVASSYGLDPAAVAQQMAAYADGTARLIADLDKRVTDQSVRLLSQLSPPDPGAEWATRRDSALAALQDYWWVQLKSGESWIDLDLLEADSTGARTRPLTPVETPTSAEVAPSLFHEIGIRVVEERFAGATLTEKSTLNHVVRPSDLVGQHMVLQFWPSAFPNSLTPAADDSGRTFRKLASEQEAWNAGLVIGGEVVARGSLAASGKTRAERTPGMGGLGGAIARGLGPQGANEAEPDSLLTAVRIEYQLNVPGRAPQTIRRTIFDLVGPAAREQWSAGQKLALTREQRVTRALSLMMQTEILPVAAQLSPEYVTYMGGKNLLANRDLLRAAITPGFGQGMADSLLRQGHQGLSPLHTLAILRQEALGNAGFIDRPGILTRHVFPTADSLNLRLHGATDIVANEVGVSLVVSDGFAARLSQGVWDTNLEALLAGSRPSGNTALAYATSGDWPVTLTSQAERYASGLPRDASALLRQDLQRGYTVVAPNEPIARDGEEFVGWWRIDPATGDALGIAANGWGQAPDYTIHLRASVEMAKPFVFAYALCQFIPQEANALNVLRETFWPGFRPYGFEGQPAPSKDFEDVAVENNRMCVIDAILAGFVATAPLLLRTLAYRVEAEVEIERGLARSRPFTKMSPSRVPTGVNPRPQGYQAGTGRYGQRPGPGGTLPGGGRPGIDPYGKTQPGLPRSSGTPSPKAAAGSQLEQAKQAYDAAHKASYEATRDFLRYKNSQFNPRSPHNRDVERLLEKAANEAGQREIDALNDVRAAERAVGDAANAVRKAQGRWPVGEAPKRASAPDPAACPPPCGNENPTVRAPAAGNENPTVRAPAAGNENPTVRAPAEGNENPTVRVTPVPQSRGALEVGNAGAASSLTPPTTRKP